MKLTLDSNFVHRTVIGKRARAGIAVAAALLASASAFAQQPVQTSFSAGTFFAPGNLVVVVEGCGVQGGTCTSAPSGNGNGTLNSSVGGYGDNQAAPLTLFQYAPTGTSSVTYVNSLVLPQAGSGANLPVSGEYGSSSEGTLQLSGTGQYLTIMGYGINSATFDAAYNPLTSSDPYGALPSGALAQSGSLTGQSYTPVARVLTLIDANGNVNSSTPLYNIFNTNNPRSIYTANGSTAYVSGQGSGCDATGGVFYIPALGVSNSSPIAITGLDAGSSSSCPHSLAQDTRDVQINSLIGANPTLYVSLDSTEGSGNNRSYVGTLGAPPSTTLYNSAGGPTQLSTENNASPNVNVTSTGKLVLTPSETNGINSSGLQINLSPQNYFFASASVLYVADSGSPKQTSATSTLGNGGLQKWVNTHSDGSGNWKLQYTLASGLNLVENPASSGNTSGATGLYGLAGQVSGSTVLLYATNYNISDLDSTYLYGITDVLSNTTPPGTSFTLLATAPPDSNFKGLSFAPTIPPGYVEVTSSPSGLAFSSANTGCAPGSYSTPITLSWTASSSCNLSVASPQSGPAGVQYIFSQWQDSNTSTTDTVTAPSTTATYTATFQTQYQVTTSAYPTAGGTVSLATGYYNAGSNLSVQATANPGYQFGGFSGGTLSGSTNPQNLTLTGPANILAIFTPLAPNMTAGVGARTVLSTSSVSMPVTLTNGGLGAATNAQITSVTPIAVTLGSGTISVASGTGTDLGTIASGGGQASTTVTFNWPSTATRASFTINFTADGGYSGSTTVTVLR